jgi:hypothetical protein
METLDNGFKRYDITFQTVKLFWCCASNARRRFCSHRNAAIRGRKDREAGWRILLSAKA